MKRILVTGGTTFVSKFCANFFVEKGYDVFVLNRNSRPQVKGVTVIVGDRHELGERLKHFHFDVVVDVTAYDREDIVALCDGLGSFGKYIMISSSAVYPETLERPFKESDKTGPNIVWGPYGMGKIEAEEELLKRVPNAYIIRPPYLYGPMNNVYREAFVFECAMQDRKFYLPKDGSMKMQFFHVHDLCRVIEAIMEREPKQHIINVGNEELISIRDWVTLCYEAVGKKPEFVEVVSSIFLRAYFCFYDYEYHLEVSLQKELIGATISLKDGLQDSYEWYKENDHEVTKKPLMTFIDETLVRTAP